VTGGDGISSIDSISHDDRAGDTGGCSYEANILIYKNANLQMNRPIID
jgi:hypothetical protein